MEKDINNKTKTILSNLFVIGFLIFLSFSALNTTSIEKTTFVIKKGMSLNSLTNVLYEKNIINNKAVFKYSVLLRGLSENIPTGTFVIEGNVSNGKIIETIFNDGPMRIKITFPEGLRSDKIVEKIDTISFVDWSLSTVIALNEFATAFFKRIFKRLRIGISINPESFNIKYFESIKTLVNVFYYDLNVYKKNKIKITER